MVVDDKFSVVLVLVGVVEVGVLLLDGVVKDVYEVIVLSLVGVVVINVLLSRGVEVKAEVC